MTTAISPQAQLADRLRDALGTHDVHPRDRALIQDAYIEAGMDDATWDDLPADVQRLVEAAEQLPPQSWDDPSDVPDDL
jgi:hypothetical protein